MLQYSKEMLQECLDSGSMRWNTLDEVTAEKLRRKDGEMEHTGKGGTFLRVEQVAGFDRKVYGCTCGVETYWIKDAAKGFLRLNLSDSSLHTCATRQYEGDAEVKLVEVAPKPVTQPEARNGASNPAMAVTNALEALLAASTGQVDAAKVREIVREEIERAEIGKDMIAVTINDREPVACGRQHKQFPLLLKVAAARLNPMLVGPAGSGKTSAAEALAKALCGIEFSFLSCNADTGAHELLGYNDMGGIYRATEFRRIYEGGGVFLLDEIDAAPGPVLTVLNAALAGKSMAFPDKLISKHAECHLLAGANTYGNGADGTYTRSQMDGATKNRFFIIDWPYDWPFVMELARGMCERKHHQMLEDWAGFVRKAHEAVTLLKMPYVIGPRAVIYAAPLLGSVQPAQLAEGLVWQGMPTAQRTQVENKIGVTR